MKLLVTGGAGFIGSNFVYYMLEKHEDVEIAVLDALTYAGDIESLLPLQNDPRFVFILGDIRNPNDVNGAIGDQQPDVIINFAAESHVDRSIEDPGIFIQTNILGTQVLLDAALANGIRRFHQVSTDEVYGDLPLDQPDLFFTETNPLKPSSPYSASKAGADLLVQAYGRTFGLPVTVSRCSNNYGPMQFPEKLIPLVITNALAGKRIPVYGKGQNVRDWLYVEDHCAAIDRILTDGTVGEVYNIGGHNEIRNIDVVRTVLAHLGRPDNLIEYVEDRPGHDLRYGIDPTKISSELGWEPGTRFEEGIGETVQWYLDNESWWQNILSGEYRKLEDRLFEGRYGIWKIEET